MPEVCLDASFLLEILFRDQFVDRAVQLWRVAADDNIDAHVPPLFHAEVTSAIRRRVFRRLLEPTAAAAMLADALRWPVHTWHEDKLVLQMRAYDFATRFNRPQAYDAQYLALAEILGCELWTADQRLVNAVSDKLAWVRWVGAPA